MKQDYDIIIVGGGIVGLMFAALLRNTPLKIVLIDHEPPKIENLTDKYDLRVSAINPSSLALFQQIELWSSLINERLCPFENMTVWTDGAEFTITAAELNLPDLGYIIENRIMRQLLWQTVQAQKNCTILAPAQLTNLMIDEWATVTTDSGTQITAKLIVGADGHNSWLRQQLNIAVKTDDYQQTALVTTVKTELPHGETAWQHFLPEGPLALLPLSDEHTCSIVWTSTPETAQELSQMAEAEFNQKITAAFGERLGKIAVIDQRIIFPLLAQHAEDYVSSHAVLIGDAAHRIHPLAGQGLNLGLMDAACLARVIRQALEHQELWYNQRILQRYQRERKYYNAQMLLGMKTINELFRTPSATLSSVRNIAMNKLNNSPLLKKVLLNIGFQAANF